MNKTTKCILSGVAAFVVCFLIIVLSRVLIRGISFADGAKDWMNWLIAVCGGAGYAYSVWKKDQEKKKD